MNSFWNSAEQLSEYDRIYHKFDTIWCCIVHTARTDAIEDGDEDEGKGKNWMC